MESDAELLQKWRDGDRAAGNELAQRHFMSVYRFFVNKVSDEVDDLIQRTFLACVEGRDRVREGASLKAYLIGIARNQLLMYVRRRQRQDQPYDEVTVAELSGSPSAVMADREEEKILLQALRRIPLDLQTTVELYYWEQLPVQDIAEILEIPPGTVKSRLYRARDALRQAVSAMEVSEPLQQTTLGGFEKWAAALRDRVRKPETADS